MNSRTTFFYGWWILMGAALGLAFSLGLVYYAFSMLIGPLEETFGWSRSAISDAPMIWVFVAIFSMVLAGKLNDRYGPRLVMSLGALLTAVAFLGLAHMTSIWHYRAAHVLLALGMTGMSQPVCMGTVARWFVRYRGAAMGFTIAGGAAGAFMASRVWPQILATHGTQGVYLSCAGVAGLILLPYFIIFMRRSPEDLGLRPLGAEEGPAASTRTGKPGSAGTAEGLTLAEARRTRNFWLVIVFTLMVNFAYNMVIMHFVPIFVAGGIPEARATHLLGYTVGLSFIGKIAGGVITDYLSIKRFLAAIWIGFCLACVSLFWAGAGWQIWSFVLVWGICLGLSGGAYSPLMPELFGRKELSSIMSFFMIFQVAGAGFGPKVAGIIFDRTQSYQVAYVGAAVLYLLCVAAVLAVRPRFLPESKRTQASPSSAPIAHAATE